jgi:hypothetical protein
MMMKFYEWLFIHFLLGGRLETPTCIHKNDLIPKSNLAIKSNLNYTNEHYLDFFWGLHTGYWKRK